MRILLIFALIFSLQGCKVRYLDSTAKLQSLELGMNHRAVVKELKASLKDFEEPELTSFTHFDKKYDVLPLYFIKLKQEGLKAGSFSGGSINNLVTKYDVFYLIFNNSKLIWLGYHYELLNSDNRDIRELGHELKKVLSAKETH